MQYIPSLCSATNRGAGIRHTWKRLLDGHCGIVSVKDRHPGFAELPCQIAAVVPQGSKEHGGWKASDWVTRDVSIRLKSAVACCVDEADRIDDSKSGKLPCLRSMRWRQRKRHLLMQAGSPKPRKRLR